MFAALALGLSPPTAPLRLAAALLAPALRTSPPPLLAAGGARTSKTVAVNRVARREFEILDEYEAGIALVGTEVRQHAHARSPSRVLLHQPLRQPGRGEYG